jgi:BirA family biotin operon repressor/biotin-[acetyl-CoA-carboxylase] ligase
LSDTEPLAQRVYRLLSDGRFHSGTELAAHCGVSRNAVWKSVSALRTLGVTVHALRNRGYRAPLASALLEPARILGFLPPSFGARLRAGHCLWCTGSTNEDLLQRGHGPDATFDFLSAEYQTAGRGRRARNWFAPPGGAICLSLSWGFPALPRDIGALGLAIGVCTLRALHAGGVRGTALKWPNDLVAGAAKLGGILIEMRAESGGPAYVVIGIGLNVALGESVMQQILGSGTQATDLLTLGAAPVDRNRLAAHLIEQFVNGLEQFQRAGFGEFAAEWRAADSLIGKPVTVSGAAGQVIGHARGIDEDGALCVQTQNGLQRFVSGEASVRMQS